MATIAELLVKIFADTKGFETGLSGAVSKANNFGLGVAKAVGIGALALGSTLVAATVAGAKGIMAFEDQAAQMEAVLKSTKGASGILKDELVSMATQLQKTTKFAEEDTMAAQNMLLTFTNIGRNVFPTATRTLLDMATAMGTDAKSGAIQLGKALNDPAEGITALTRVGVTFTEEQKKLIQSLQESGNMAGAQSVILQELQKEFGGSAEAAGKTFSGALEITKNAIGEVAESMAAQFMPGIAELMTAVKDAAESGEWSKLGEAATKVLVGFVAKLPEMAKFGADVIVSVVQGLASNAPELVKGAVDMIGTLGTTLWEHRTEIWEAAKTIGIALVEGIWAGVKSLGSWLWNNMTEFIYNNAIKNVQEELEVNSPSKVYERFGVNMIYGLAKGMEENQSVVTDAVKNTVEVAKGFADFRMAEKAMEETGAKLMDNLAKGIEKGAAAVAKKVKAVAPYLYGENNGLITEVNTSTGAIRRIASQATNAEISDMASRHSDADVGVLNAMVRANKLAEVPQYAQGTPYVPNTGLAFIHEGEEIIPAGRKRGGQTVINITGNYIMDDRSISEFGERLVDTLIRNGVPALGY